MNDVAFVQFTDADVVRHSLVTRIVQAYDRYSKGVDEMELFEEKEPRRP